MTKINEILLYAQVSTPHGKPPTVRVLQGAYRGPGKKKGTIKLKCEHAKYPLIVDEKYVAGSADAARTILIARVEEACDEHSRQISQMWEALGESDRTINIHWPTKTRPETIKAPAISKAAIVNPLTPLKHNVAPETLGNSVQARLIRAHQRRTR